MKSYFIKLLALLVLTLSFGCKKAIISTSKQAQNVEAVDSVNVVFSTNNHFTESGDWYLYQVSSEGDTILNFGTPQSPKYLRVIYTSYPQNGSTGSYSMLKLLSGTPYKFGVYDEAKNQYKPEKNVTFSLNDTLSNGNLNFNLNY